MVLPPRLEELCLYNTVKHIDRVRVGQSMWNNLPSCHKETIIELCIDRLAENEPIVDLLFGRGFLNHLKILNLKSVSCLNILLRRRGVVKALTIRNCARGVDTLLRSQVAHLQALTLDNCRITATPLDMHFRNMTCLYLTRLASFNDNDLAQLLTDAVKLSSLVLESCPALTRAGIGKALCGDEKPLLLQQLETLCLIRVDFDLGCLVAAFASVNSVKLKKLWIHTASIADSQISQLSQHQLVESLQELRILKKFKKPDEPSIMSTVRFLDLFHSLDTVYLSDSCSLSTLYESGDTSATTSLLARALLRLKPSLRSLSLVSLPCIDDRLIAELFDGGGERDFGAMLVELNLHCLCAHLQLSTRSLELMATRLESGRLERLHLFGLRASLEPLVVLFQPRCRFRSLSFRVCVNLSSSAALLEAIVHNCALLEHLDLSGPSDFVTPRLVRTLGNTCAQHLSSLDLSGSDLSSSSGSEEESADECLCHLVSRCSRLRHLYLRDVRGGAITVRFLRDYVATCLKYTLCLLDLHGSFESIELLEASIEYVRHMCLNKVEIIK